MDMRKALLRDFGLDIPIVGQLGISGSKNSPISITAAEPLLIGQAASDTVACLHRGMNRAQEPQEGVLWRTLDGGLRRVPETQLGIYRIERVRFNPVSFIAETVAYYFSLAETRNAGLDYFGMGKGMSLASLDEVLPSEIGWLHHDAIQNVDYVERHNRPDLGVSAAYGAIGIKATLYVYPKPKITENERLSGQFEQATAHLETIIPDAKALRDTISSLGDYLKIWDTAEGEQATALAMMDIDGYFIKIRATWHRTPLLDQAFIEFKQSAFKIFANCARN